MLGLNRVTLMGEVAEKPERNCAIRLKGRR